MSALDDHLEKVLGKTNDAITLFNKWWPALEEIMREELLKDFETIQTCIHDIDTIVNDVLNDDY